MRRTDTLRTIRGSWLNATISHFDVDTNASREELMASPVNAYTLLNSQNSKVFEESLTS